MKTNLNSRQKKFCEEYLLDLNATAAYRRAGYRAKTDAAARASACEILTNPNVQAYIQELQAQRSERTGIAADRVLQEYARLAFANITQVLSFNADGVLLKDSQALSEDITAAIESVSSSDTPSGKQFRVKMHGKPAALDFVAQHLGLKNDLNQAFSVFRKYGYRVKEDDAGYRLIDTYKGDRTNESTNA